jgi:hypothetical protein
MKKASAQKEIPTGTKVILTGIHMCDIDADGNPVFTYFGDEEGDNNAKTKRNRI